VHMLYFVPIGTQHSSPHIRVPCGGYRNPTSPVFVCLRRVMHSISQSIENLDSIFSVPIIQYVAFRSASSSSRPGPSHTHTHRRSSCTKDAPHLLSKKKPCPPSKVTRLLHSCPAQPRGNVAKARADSLALCAQKPEFGLSQSTLITSFLSPCSPSPHNLV
jgi:hypothetical protein